LASNRRTAATAHGGVEEHLESADYLQKRQLKTGTAGWILLAGLGVSYVVSGDYSGWNFGLAQGGFGGLAIAAVVIAGMYLALVLGMAELSSALPAAGGGYTFARRALGPWGGFANGHGDPHRVFDRTGRDRDIHRCICRVAWPVRHPQRLVDLPRRLRRVHRYSPVRCR
jgi:hypothetical protein